jgi:hypothetical protein
MARNPKHHKASKPPERQPVPPSCADIPPATRERVRLALVELAKRQQKLTIRGVRDEAMCDQNSVSKILRAYRAKRMPPLFQPWDEAADPPSEDQAKPGSGRSPATKIDPGSFAERVKEAKTDGDREQVALEAAAMVATGDLSPSASREIKGMLAEARQAAVKKRATEPPPEDPTKLLLASAEAMEAARAIDLIVDDARRERVLAIVAAELEADLVAVPNVDEGGL